MAVRILLAAIWLAIPVAAEIHTQAQKEWALAAGALVAQIDREPRLDLLGGVEHIADVAEARRQNLRESWGIGSRQELFETLQSLYRDDSDSMRIGWNYPRLINLARWGYAAGYLQEDEAWPFIFSAAGKLQKTFSSWQELGMTYMEARAAWYRRNLAARRQVEYAYRQLLYEPESPWRKYPWNLDLGNGYQAPPSTDKSAWLELAAHPEGLMCVRITLPDHREGVDYLDAIESAVGCSPHITGEKRIGTNWILDTECFQPGTLHGAEIVASFNPEAVATQLRREGVTQLFTVFEHIPHGSDTQVHPPGFDSWFNNGWQWYFDMRSLKHPYPETTLTYGVAQDDVRAFLMGALLLAMASLAGAYAVRGRPWWMSRFPLFFWGSWMVLSISFYGLAVAGFWSGGEGLGADMRGIIWYGSLALLLRWGAEIILANDHWRAALPGVTFGRTLAMSFTRVMSEVPVATVLVLLCDAQRPLNLATVIVLLGLGAAISLTAWHFRLRAERLQGGLAKSGELYDAVWALAKKMNVPLRRLYILPEELSPRLGPKAGTHGDLLIPERLLKSAYRREVDGIVTYQMMLIKTRHLSSFWSGLLPVVVLLVWRIYNAQNAESASTTLMVQAGVVLSAFGLFGQTLRRMNAKAQAAFKKSGGDAEGWIAGLARLARLSGAELEPAAAVRIAQECGVPTERLPDLKETGFPETGHYAVPDYDRTRLALLS